jgi:hypothetical protein
MVACYSPPEWFAESEPNPVALSNYLGGVALFVAIGNDSDADGTGKMSDRVAFIL